jgi:MFS family permease
MSRPASVLSRFASGVAAASLLLSATAFAQPGDVHNSALYSFKVITVVDGLVPFFLKRFGMKATLLVGMLAWAARYVLFSFGNAGDLVVLLLVGIALHGVCYDFFFVSGQVFTDSKAGPRYKSAAQGLITLATYGVGMLIGFWIAGRLTDAYALAAGHDWPAIWLYPAGFAALVAISFAVLFKNEVVEYRAQRAAGVAQ